MHEELITSYFEVLRNNSSRSHFNARRFARFLLIEFKPWLMCDTYDPLAGYEKMSLLERFELFVPHSLEKKNVLSSGGLPDEEKREE
jgi:hypothetical protein